MLDADFRSGSFATNSRCSRKVRLSPETGHIAASRRSDASMKLNEFRAGRTLFEVAPRQGFRENSNFNFAASGA